MHLPAQRGRRWVPHLTKFDLSAGTACRMERVSYPLLAAQISSPADILAAFHRLKKEKKKKEKSRIRPLHFLCNWAHNSLSFPARAAPLPACSWEVLPIAGRMGTQAPLLRSDAERGFPVTFAAAECFLHYLHSIKGHSVKEFSAQHELWALNTLKDLAWYL